MSSVIEKGTNAKNATSKDSQSTTPIHDRLSLGVDIGTSHCEVIAFGKNYDQEDEEKYHYTSEPIHILCNSSLILFAKDNESSSNFVRKFLQKHKLSDQSEYLNGKEIPYIFADQVEALLDKKNITSEELDILRRSSYVAYPIKNKKDADSYSEQELAVIRLNIERSLLPFVALGYPLDITFAKPCEAGSQYDQILKEITAQISNQNESHDNRFIIRSEAIFTGHYLTNMIDSTQGAIAVCDVGAGTGDVYVFDQDDSSTKAMKSFNFAGNKATAELIDQLYKNCKVDISERDANRLKEEYGYLSGYNAPQIIKPVLVDLYIQGKPRKVRAGKSIDAALRPIAHDAVNTLIKVFKEYEGLSPKTIALTGYQGQLPGLDKAIEEGLALEDYDVQVKNLKAFGESDPRSIVAKGAEDYSRNVKNEKWTIL